MGPLAVSFPEVNSSITLLALDASVMGGFLENVGWAAVGGITGLWWVDSRATHFHKVTLKILCQRRGAGCMLLCRWQEEREKGEETEAEEKVKTSFPGGGKPPCHPCCLPSS